MGRERRASSLPEGDWDDGRVAQGVFVGGPCKLATDGRLWKPGPWDRVLEGARVEQAGRKWLLLPLPKIPGACAGCELKDTISVVEAAPVTVRPGGNGGMIAASGAVW